MAESAAAPNRGHTIVHNAEVTRLSANRPSTASTSTGRPT